MATIGNVIPINIVARLIGFRDCDPMELLQSAFDSTALVGGTSTLDQLNGLIVRIGEIQSWVQGQIADTSGAPGVEGILAAFRRALDDGVLELGEATLILHTLLSAGGETTSSLLGNAVRILAEDQALQQRLREDMSAIPAFVEEALRLESPFKQQMRSVAHETTLGGVMIPAGSTVVLLFGAANRDPAQYVDPETVDLNRQPRQRHLAFGHGIHYCVGAALARIEARAVLTALLEQTSSIALDTRSSPRWAESFLVRRHESLPLTVTTNG